MEVTLFTIGVIAVIAAVTFFVCRIVNKREKEQIKAYERSVNALINATKSLSNSADRAIKVSKQLKELKNK